MAAHELPVPPHFNPDRAGDVWRVPYHERAREARQWATLHGLPAAAGDRFRFCLVAVDEQNTFCIPGFELYVAGRSGTGAVDDTRRLCGFIYRNLGIITQICPTMDTHRAMQIFHPLYLVNGRGEHPEPFTLITAEDLTKGLWRFNPAIARSLQVSEEYGHRHLLHYAKRLREGGKYDLTVWPYHGMLGGIGHALVSSLEEALFFHTVARYSQPDFHVKGDSPFTEHYSVLGPEVLEDHEGSRIAAKSEKILRKVLDFDAVVIVGQAKSHCVAWTIDDLLSDILARDENLARKVYLMEDCSSPVVVPGVMDYTDKADAAFRRFADAGMHVVRSTDPVSSWPGIGLTT